MDKKVISIPVWALKELVERDWKNWRFENDISLELEEELPTFPEYDSTILLIEALEAHGILFDQIVGTWVE